MAKSKRKAGASSKAPAKVSKAPAKSARASQKDASAKGPGAALKPAAATKNGKAPDRKASVPEPVTSAAEGLRAGGRRRRVQRNPNAWSVSIPTRRTNVLLLGISYPCVRLTLDKTSRKFGFDVREHLLHPHEESVEQAIEMTRRGFINEMDGRDLARCLALEAGNDTLAYTVSQEEAAVYSARHLDTNFCGEKFTDEVIAHWGPDVKFRQVILDYFWCPTGWVGKHWTTRLFTDTLPDLVSKGLLDFSSGGSDVTQEGQVNASLFEHSTAGFGGAVVYLPFCFHCFREVVAARKLLFKYYNISFLRKSNMAEHALWAATNSIDADSMQSWLGKEISQEENYCSFTPQQLRQASDVEHVSKDEMLDVLKGMEDFDQVRFIKLTALDKFNPNLKGCSNQNEKGKFLGLQRNVQRGFGSRTKRKPKQTKAAKQNEAAEASTPAQSPAKAPGRKSTAKKGGEGSSSKKAPPKRGRKVPADGSETQQRDGAAAVETKAQQCSTGMCKAHFTKVNPDAPKPKRKGHYHLCQYEDCTKYRQRDNGGMCRYHYYLTNPGARPKNWTPEGVGRWPISDSLGGSKRRAPASTPQSDSSGRKLGRPRKRIKSEKEVANSGPGRTPAAGGKMKSTAAGNGNVPTETPKGKKRKQVPNSNQKMAPANATSKVRGKAASAAAGTDTATTKTIAKEEPKHTDPLAVAVAVAEETKPPAVAPAQIRDGSAPAVDSATSPRELDVSMARYVDDILSADPLAKSTSYSSKKSHPETVVIEAEEHSIAHNSPSKIAGQIASPGSPAGTKDASELAVSVTTETDANVVPPVAFENARSEVATAKIVVRAPTTAPSSHCVPSPISEIDSLYDEPATEKEAGQIIGGRIPGALSGHSTRLPPAGNLIKEEKKDGGKQQGAELKPQLGPTASEVFALSTDVEVLHESFGGSESELAEVIPKKERAEEHRAKVTSVNEDSSKSIEDISGEKAASLDRLDAITQEVCERSAVLDGQVVEEQLTDVMGGLLEAERSRSWSSDLIAGTHNGDDCSPETDSNFAAPGAMTGNIGADVDQDRSELLPSMSQNATFLRNEETEGIFHPPQKRKDLHSPSRKRKGARDELKYPNDQRIMLCKLQQLPSPGSSPIHTNSPSPGRKSTSRHWPQNGFADDSNVPAFSDNYESTKRSVSCRQQVCPEKNLDSLYQDKKETQEKVNKKGQTNCSGSFNPLLPGDVNNAISSGTDGESDAARTLLSLHSVSSSPDEQSGSSDHSAENHSKSLQKEHMTASLPKEIDFVQGATSESFDEHYPLSPASSTKGQSRRLLQTDAMHAAKSHSQVHNTNAKIRHEDGPNNVKSKGSSCGYVGSESDGKKAKIPPAKWSESEKKLFSDIVKENGYSDSKPWSELEEAISSKSISQIKNHYYTHYHKKVMAEKAAAAAAAEKAETSSSIQNEPIPGTKLASKAKSSRGGRKKPRKAFNPIAEPEEALIAKQHPFNAPAEKAEKFSSIQNEPIPGTKLASKAKSSRGGRNKPRNVTFPIAESEKALVAKQHPSTGGMTSPESYEPTSVALASVAAAAPSTFAPQPWADGVAAPGAVTQHLLREPAENSDNMLSHGATMTAGGGPSSQTLSAHSMHSPVSLQPVPRPGLEWSPQSLGIDHFSSNSNSSVPYNGSQNIISTALGTNTRTALGIASELSQIEDQLQIEEQLCNVLAWSNYLSSRDQIHYQSSPYGSVQFPESSFSPSSNGNTIQHVSPPQDHSYLAAFHQDIARNKSW